MAIRRLPRPRDPIQLGKLIGDILTGQVVNAVARLLVAAGQTFSDYQDKAFRNLPSKRLQVDEAWAFYDAKQKNVAAAKAAPPQAGDIWTWAAIDADTKLVPSSLVGSGDAHAAHAFIGDLALRLANRVQLTSDARKPYLQAVEEFLGTDIAYAMLVKIYGTPEGTIGRYSPGECVGAEKRRVEGRPDPAHISTSFAERQNLSMAHGRASLHAADECVLQEGGEPRPFGRDLLHALQLRSHASDVSLHPATAAGVTAKLWELADMVNVLAACRTGVTG